MFKVGSKARVVIVVEHPTLMSARGGGFVEVAMKLRQLFKEDFKDIIYSCLLVVTKLPLSIMTHE